MADKIQDESQNHGHKMQGGSQGQETEHSTAPPQHHSATEPSSAPSAREKTDESHSSCCRDDVCDDGVKDNVHDRQGAEVSTVVPHPFLHEQMLNQF